MRSKQLLDRAEVERIAALAHLDLTESEKEMFAQQLADILAHAQRIQELQTAGVPPTSHVLGRDPAFRDDLVRPSLERDAALANAPESTAGLFKVPRIIG